MNGLTRPNFGRFPRGSRARSLARFLGIGLSSVMSLELDYDYRILRALREDEFPAFRA